MPFNKYIGRTKESIIITKNEDVDLTDVVKFHAILLSNTRVRVSGELLEFKEDEICEDSFWPYVPGQKLEIRFDDSNDGYKGLQLKLVKLIPNPENCE